MSSSEFRYTNGSDTSALDISDNEGDDDHVDEEAGDYSTRMDELFADDDGKEQSSFAYGSDGSDNEEDFVYTGADADVSVGYRDQLRDVLGEESDAEVHEVEQSLLVDQNSEELHSEDEDPMDVLSDQTHSTPITTPPRIGSPIPPETPSKLARPFLHPTVSRLRSFTPQSSRVPSNSSAGTNALHTASPAPSHFSSMSRMSSVSNFHAPSSNGLSDVPNGPPKLSERDVFKWTELRNISHHVYAASSSKASALLGAGFGTPTVLAANGLICIGTDEGKICVYDFRQTLKCVCSNSATGKSVGPVTALALSHDHTYVASGHSTGHIQLFDLKNPQTPARFVPPTTLAIISSGRKEGHIIGSRIINIGFVAGRHTALVSADEHGLAFYHSLGKVLFVEAPDILRILGKYPLDGPAGPESPTTPVASSSAPQGRKKSRYTILAMMPLPLGTTSHPSDAYQIVALLTPHKLVVVGLKPTPKTWFKFNRGNDDARPRSRARGTLCWFPSVLPPSNKEEGTNHPVEEPSTPLLACSWGRTMHILRVFESRSRQLVRHPKTGKSSELEVGNITYLDAGKWSADEDILALQWLNVNQVAVITATALQVYDTNRSRIIERITFDGLSLVSPSLRLTMSGAASYSDSVGDIAHSIRVYKGKIFVLGRNRIEVGTLLTWADKILSFVQEGDFLGAIELTRSYYLREAPGNTNGLPDDPLLCNEVIGKKIRELMNASAQYAFSEDRMTDATHSTPDGRGVDRTSLFEDLVSTCARACIALDDFEFLFEDMFQLYDDNGISRIFLTQLEKFVLSSEIHHVPPRITQRLVAMHDENSRPDLVERIIWHIDAECLDINQAIQLCQTHHLYDALIYVYTRALRDYVAPVVELLGLIRKVHQYRRRTAEYTRPSTADDSEMESVILNAYKIYPYLANILSGLIYPSEQLLEEDEAFRAKKDVYAFLFFGRSSVWPPGDGGKLVVTADEEGGLEPTYPYVQQLLRYDAESFLHSLDIAFEDAYLNDSSQTVDRLVIVRILMDIVSTGNLSQTDKTFIHIFVSRNVPKYPQFLPIPTSTLHNILVSLAEDPDPNTREDRQLAAEYLLSAYNPHDVPHIIDLFRHAGFFRILRSWHRHDGQWGPLLLTFLEDPTLPSFEMFNDLDETLDASTRASRGDLPPEIAVIVQDALSLLVQKSASSTAVLIDKHVPSLHDQALDCLGDADDDRFVYLQRLLGPLDDEEYNHSHSPHPSRNLSLSLRRLYITLQCKFHPEDVITVLQYLPPDIPDWDQVISTCESNKVFDAAMWALNWQGKPLEALEKADAFEKALALNLVDIFTSASDESLPDVSSITRSLEAIGRTGIALCVERSQGFSATDVPLEDIWYKLLNSQINCVQTLTGCCSPEALSKDVHTLFSTALAQSEWQALSALRSLVQETFSALVSVTTTRAVSFPRLFNRLVNAAPQSHVATGTQYTEFRSILTGMLESYRSDGDMLIITKHLVDRDLFETLEDAARERVRGWASSRTNCSICRKPLLDPIKEPPNTDEASTDHGVVVSRTGSIYHSRCSPR